MRSLRDKINIDHLKVGGCAFKKHSPLFQPLLGIAFAMPSKLFGSWEALKSNTPPLLNDSSLVFLMTARIYAKLHNASSIT